jgi:ethanolaminephosphotransferase
MHWAQDKTFLTQRTDLTLVERSLFWLKQLLDYSMSNESECRATDGTHVHAWLWEDPTETLGNTSNGTAVITKDGLEHIAHHKYVAGAYTYLDTMLNPIWTRLTELLPMSLAPNMVTTMGGLHCCVSYFAVWFYSKDYNKEVPDWLVVLCAYCTFAYYTLDCMDGKQARRTGASSPLGQLFDHGFDCICNLSHISNVAMFTSCGLSEECFWFFAMQGSLQFSFFMAQWEEYYTHVLPHAVGNFVGVTEVSY